jgi:CubicO group peptidase (beta-lactamase class C family)
LLSNFLRISKAQKFVVEFDPVHQMFMKKIYLFVFLSLASFCQFDIQAQVISSQQIDSLVNLTLKTFDVPGISVAVVKDGKVIHSKGYGVRSLKNNLPMDENTLVGIASNSKAFTASALAMLVDEGKLKWDDKVRDFIPEFKLYNPYVTEEFTIRDLLTHRSGLGLGAGDLMMFPDSSDFTRKDIIYNLRFLKPVSGFRTQYDYDNNLYIVAGEVIAKASGLSWEDFIEQKIMKPLGMNSSSASMGRLKNKQNLISPHAPVNGKVQALNIDWSETANAAGGIVSNLPDMCKWITMQMNNGQYGDSLKLKLFSRAQHAEMWSPQTIIPTSTVPPYNTHFSAYGLGWFLSDVKGYKQVTHTGGLAGVVTQVVLLPEMKLGIIVLTNQQSGAAFTAISSTIKDSYLGIKGYNRVKQLADRVQKGEMEAKEIMDGIVKEIETQKKNTKTKPDFNLVAGTYKDDWFGEVIIGLKNGKPWLDCKRSPKLTGELQYLKANTYIVRWSDRSFDADAYIHFGLDQDGKAESIKMKAISPLTDFSFDFHDLDLKRLKKL